MRLPCPLHSSTAASACGQLSAAVHQMAQALGQAVDAKDKRLFEHSDLTADLASMLAMAYGLSSRQAEVIHIAGHVHDIGKIGVPDSVLLKPGRLNDAEWTLMREHPAIGAAILKPIELFSENGGVADIVLAHHERFDGGGYPRGIKGEAIPLGGRIMAIADSMAAMLEDRTYRPAMSLGDALTEIARGAGRQYDPALCRAFLANPGAVELVLEAHGRHPARED